MGAEDDARRLYRALALTVSHLDHVSSDGVAPVWRRRWPDQAQAVSRLIGRVRRLLADLNHYAPERE